MKKVLIIVAIALIAILITEHIKVRNTLSSKEEHTVKATVITTKVIR
jgi:tellurite resistance protein TehA-like permease